uniref:Protein regulator of cytokinesis 1 n=1 Tax=Strongyloides stercoralis TaxID=6248 RepID=A0A0K0E7V0_STRER
MLIVGKSHELINYLDKNIKKIEEMWDEIGMEEEIRVEKTTDFCEKIKSIMDSVVTEETTNYNSVLENSKKFLEEINSLRVALKLKKYNVDILRLNTVSYCEVLKKEVENLKVERDKLIQKQIDTLKTLENLSYRLSVPIKNIVICNSLLDPKEWDEVQKEFTRLTDLFEKRTTEFVTTKKEILRLKGFTKKICTPKQLDMLNVDVGREDFICSKEILNKIKSLLEEAQNEYDKWRLEKIGTYNELIQQLYLLYDKCAIPDLERLFSDDLNIDFVDDEDINKVQEEIVKYELLYNNHKDLYDTYYKWLIAWKDYLKVKADLANPNVYKDRTHDIQQVLLRQKDANTRQKLYIDKLKLGDGSKIKINGSTMYEKALSNIENHKKQEELKKQLKLEKKNKVINTEALDDIGMSKLLEKFPRHKAFVSRRQVRSDTFIMLTTPTIRSNFNYIRNNSSIYSNKKISGANRFSIKKRDPLKILNKTSTKRIKY